VFHRQSEVLRQGTGIAVAGATVTVYMSGTAVNGDYANATKASIYATLPAGAAYANATVTADANGEYSYYVPSGVYDEVLKYGSITETRTGIQMYDLVELEISSSRLTAESFGALGNGVNDDGPALAAMSAALNAAGGGVIDLYPGRTYWIGSQTLNGPGPDGGGVYTFAPDTPYPINVVGCTKPVVINGNGAVVKCLPGKKYGSFNENGTARADAAPFTGAPGIAGNNIATPYSSMVDIRGNSGPVFVHGMELNGNIQNQTIGGVWGDTGRQLPMTGLNIRDNTGPVTILNVVDHHHGLDGGVGNGPGDRNVRENVHLIGCRFVNNGRQGFSLTGGNGWHFEDCDFNETAVDLGAGFTAPAYSPPGAGFDMEAEGGRWVTNTLFTNCRFEDNTYGVGFVSDTNAFVENATFKNCTFVGATTYSIWPYNPGFVFEDCTIVGAFVHAHSNANPLKATRFYRCRITDDPALSSTGAVYDSGGSYFDGGATNILFDECHFKNVFPGRTLRFGNTGAPIDGADLVHLRNCVVERAGGAGAGIYGIYSGVWTRLIDADKVPDAALAAANGAIMTYAGLALDSFYYVNTATPSLTGRYAASVDSTGKRIYYASAVYNPPSLALGAKDAIQTMAVTGAVLGDLVDEVSFSVDLAGARIHAWVSAADTVSFYFTNENGANPLDLASGTVRVKVRQT
jgi:hypothetical protein